MSAVRAALLALALSALIPAPAGAGIRPGDSPRALHLRAEEHYRRGDFAAALGDYQRAYRLTGLPGFLFNMAQALRRMGHWNAALAHYQQFAAAVPQAANRVAVSELILLCEVRVRSDLAARSPPASPPPARQVPLAAMRPVQEPNLVEAPAMAEPRGGRGRAALLWTGGGLAGALLVSGTVTGVLALRASDEHGGPGISPERRAQLKEHGEAYRTASTVSFAVGGTLAVSTALIYWLYRPRAARRVSISLLPGGASVGVGQSF